MPAAASYCINYQLTDAIGLYCRRRLSEASRPKLKSLFAKVASNLSMRKNRDDLSEQQSSTIDLEDNVDDGTHPQTTFDHDDHVDDSEKQPPTTFADDDGDQPHSDGEASISSADEQLIGSNDTNVNIDKAMLGQIYVDPIIAKLKITDVIPPIPVAVWNIDRWGNVFSSSTFLECQRYVRAGRRNRRRHCESEFFRFTSKQHRRQRRASIICKLINTQHRLTANSILRIIL